MTRVAAIDIGTNSVRLLVAEVNGDVGDDPGAPLTTLDRRMRITRLGQGVHALHRLAPEAIERTLTVLREYRGVIDDLGAEHVRATATSAARDSENRDEFFGPATEVLGRSPELLSGEEEARLSFLGATTGLDAPAPFLVIDIGGGSTELVVGTTEPEALRSLDVGCVRITEQWLESDPPAPEELSNAVSAVRDELADVAREIPSIRDAATVVGLAGTITTVAAIEQGLLEYDRDRIHHFRLTRAAAEEVFRTLAIESAEERRHNPGLEAERVDVIVGGAVVLVSIFRTLDLDEILVSEADILDGLARSIVARIQ
jgi:exopolyphosphatase / guanosine-5'-triphosphate,3'-diphosphate pyrophosphatase